MTALASGTLIWPILAPLGAAMAALLLGGRLPRLTAALGAAVTASATMAAAAAVWRDGPARYAVGGWGAPLGIDLYLDGLSALLLLTGALVATGATAHAIAEPRPAGDRPRAAGFWTAWFLLWAALNAVFSSADVFNLYVTLELLTLSSVALIAMAGGAAVAAALRYLLWALAGSLLYLLGVALYYAATGTLDVYALAGAPGGTVMPVAAGLMTAGLVLKAALFPLHFWLPPAHGDAPPPVSALLSALVVMAAFYILLRLWVTVFTALDTAIAGQVLGALGGAAILVGAVQAYRQARLKLVVAYSTVAQVGYLFLCFALGAGWHATVYLAVSHACAKAAMFLGAGIVTRASGNDRVDGLAGVSAQVPLTLFAIGASGVSLMGLPPSGGFVGKWLLLEASLGSGRWWIAALVVLGGLGAGAYVFRVIAACIREGPATPVSPVPVTAQGACIVLAIAALVLGLVAPAPFRLLDVGAPFAAVSGP